MYRWCSNFSISLSLSPFPSLFGSHRKGTVWHMVRLFRQSPCFFNITRQTRRFQSQSTILGILIILQIGDTSSCFTSLLHPPLLSDGHVTCRTTFTISRVFFNYVCSPNCTSYLSSPLPNSLSLSFPSLPLLPSLSLSLPLSPTFKGKPTPTSIVVVVTVASYCLHFVFCLCCLAVWLQTIFICFGCCLQLISFCSPSAYFYSDFVTFSTKY